MGPVIYNGISPALHLQCTNLRFFLNRYDCEMFYFLFFPVREPEMPGQPGAEKARSEAGGRSGSLQPAHLLQPPPLGGQEKAIACLSDLVLSYLLTFYNLHLFYNFILLDERREL